MAMSYLTSVFAIIEALAEAPKGVGPRTDNDSCLGGGPREELI